MVLHAINMTQLLNQVALGRLDLLPDEKHNYTKQYLIDTTRSASYLDLHFELTLRVSEE